MKAEERYGAAGFVCEFPLPLPLFFKKKGKEKSLNFLSFLSTQTSEMVNINPYIPTQTLRAITELPTMRKGRKVLSVCYLPHGFCTVLRWRGSLYLLPTWGIFFFGLLCTYILSMQLCILNNFFLTGINTLSVFLLIVGVNKNNTPQLVSWNARSRWL